MDKEIMKLTLASIHSEPHAAFDICGIGHPTHECQASIEEINTVENYNFNAMGQRHPDFSWSSPGGTANAWKQNNCRPQGQGAPAYQNQQRQQFQRQQPIQPGLEDLMKAFIIQTDERLEPHSVPIREHRASIKKICTGFENMERQVGYLATLLSNRIPGALPADTKRNSKETVNVVTLRCGQVLKDPTITQKDVIIAKESGEQLKSDDDKKKKGPMKTEKKKKKGKSRREEHDESEHMHVLPFAQKLCREKLDKQKLEKENGEIRPVPISLQPTDQTTLIPKGIVEDVLVRIDKFIFPVDFIVVKMEDNKEVPLILGRPFLIMGRAILDIHERKLMLEWVRRL
ncbi:uncharacterized protein [Nicotiana tomentosiformis]|uniref:uncharacterized protein n=1 Tax=Nicotiana tomentosiformis TaxID=4098 RepID=UPI00388CD1B5